MKEIGWSRRLLLWKVETAEGAAMGLVFKDMAGAEDEDVVGSALPPRNGFRK